MAHRKNVKRIDPRYFLNETVDRDINTGEALEEERQAPVTHWVAGPGGLVDQHGDVFVKHGTAFAATRSPTQKGMMVIGVGHGTGTERWFGERPVPYEDVQKHRSNPNYNPPQPGPDSRTSRNSPVVQEETVDRGEEELEEGWDDIKAGAGKAWKKTKRGAEDAWDTVKQTADDVVSSPLDLGKRHRRRRKNRDDERRAASKAEDDQLDRRQAARKAKADKEAAHKAGVNAEYDRWSNDPARLAKVDAEQRRSRSRVASDKAQYQDSLRVDKHKKKMYDREQEVTGKKDKRYSNTVGSGFEE